MKPAFITAFGVRSSSPSVVKTHERPNAKTSTSASAATHARARPPSGRKPRIRPSDDDHRAGEEVADAVAEQRADQRRRPPDRQRAEAVDDALGQVGVQRDARVDGREQDRHDEDARAGVVQVLAGRAGDRAAEQVREHQHEHDRRDGHVEQLLGHVLDLQHRAPAERQRRRQRAGGRGGARRSRRAAWRHGDACRRRRRRALTLHARLRPPVSVSSSAGWPVRARNTSSRLGWPSEKSATPMPARASAATPRRAAIGVGARRAVSAAGSASRLTGAERASRARAAASARCSGSQQPHVQRAGADRRLQLARRALGDHLAVVDHRDPVGELVGLVEVLGGEQDRRALGGERADDVPHLVAAARVEAGGRLVEEEQLGRDDDAGGDVEPAAHAAGVVLDLPAGRVGRARTPRAARRRAPSRRRAARPSSRPSRTRFSRPVRSSSTEANWPVRLTRPRTASASRDDVVAEHPGAAAVGRAAAWPASGSSSSCRRRWGRGRRRRCRAGTARSTPSTARVVAERLTRPEASIASGACVVIGLLTLGPVQTRQVFRHSVRRAVIGLQRIFLIESCDQPRGQPPAGWSSSGSSTGPRNWAL